MAASKSKPALRAAQVLESLRRSAPEFVGLVERASPSAQIRQAEVVGFTLYGSMALSSKPETAASIERITRCRSSIHARPLSSASARL